ncbi:MAG TPA: phosphate ABC transporter substrate-binding protein PstS [Magnetospirillaceae bacterium]|jgi:phosphate transport system substrate-binding protein
MKSSLRAFLGAALVGAAGCLALSVSAHAGEITGAGATFPYPAYAKWAAAYKDKSGVALNYQSIGSGGGIKQIKAKTVDFGASDMPLEPKDLNESGLFQWPMIMGGVVPVVNIPGVSAGQVLLTGPVLADLYLGKITKWNDPAITKLNPSVKFPDLAVAVVHRSDGSGTSFLFTSYLSQVSGDWDNKVGANTAVEWPVGIGGKGNEGVANFTGQTPGAIGYVEYAYALQNKLAFTKMMSRDGAIVSPEMKAFSSAAANADWANAPGFKLVLVNQPGQDSWPITGASFILLHKSQDKPEQAKEVLKFFDWAYHNGGPAAEELAYVPIPDNVVKLVEAAWSKNISGGSTPIWPAN